jgi:hypothetical protein
VARVESPVVVVCDYCSKKASDDPQPNPRARLSGGHWMEGWYSLYGPLNTHLSGSSNPERDFCSKACLRSYWSGEGV